MSFPEFPVDPAPDLPVNITYKPAILQAQFGDQYSQETGDGINSGDVLSAQLQWSVLYEDEKNILMDFLKARQGYERFTYQLPGLGSAMTFVSQQFGEQKSTNNTWTVTAQLDRRFDVG